MPNIILRAAYRSTIVMYPFVLFWSRFLDKRHGRYLRKASK